MLMLNLSLPNIMQPLKKTQHAAHPGLHLLWRWLQPLQPQDSASTFNSMSMSHAIPEGTILSIMSTQTLLEPTQESPYPTRDSLITFLWVSSPSSLHTTHQLCEAISEDHQGVDLVLQHRFKCTQTGVLLHLHCNGVQHHNWQNHIP